MKYCSKCGNEMEDNAVACEKCGNTLVPVQTAAVNQPAKTSVLGILAFILSIVGFLTAFLRIGILLDIVAIILAIVTLVKSKRKPIKRGLSIAGIIIAGISLAIMTTFYMGSYITDISKIKNVEKMIDNIGQVTVDSKTAIDEAEEKYNNLTDEEKEKIDNYETLVSAMNSYIELLKSDMLAKAERINLFEIEEEAKGNINVAKTKYDGKIFTTGAVVNYIGDDYIRCACSWGYMVYALAGESLFSDTYIYFANSDDLLKINKGENIKVVGKFELSGSSRYTIRDAYLLSDEEYDAIQ